MKDRIELLIELLFDDDSSIAERDDAAMDLGDFSDDQVITALLLRAMNVNEDEMVLNSCGESIGNIWSKKDFFDEKVYHSLPGTVRFGVYVVIKSRKPEWVISYQLENDDFN